ncbi:MAG: hypothetical protein JXA52_06115 [Planctomycetes bacterium]|nr:hypothetical protein [Planctomycetota bacterium]
MSALEIRRATRADIPAILELWNESTEHHTEGESYYQPPEGDAKIFALQMQEEIEDGSKRVAVVLHDGEMVGYHLAEK